MTSLLIQIGPVILLILLGLSIGRIMERGHIRSLARRQRGLAHIKVTNLKSVPDPNSIHTAILVMGEAVIATDYYKSFVSSFRNLIGGEMPAYRTLLLRARHEAHIRMLTQAKQIGATEIHNVRYETSNIRSGSQDSKNKLAVSVEIFAFGTAVIRHEQNHEPTQS